MKSVFDFIVEPYGQRYNNEVKVGDKSLIINTQSESFKSVNNIAKVIATPKAFKTPVKKGDLIMIHHNVFRRWYNVRGEERNSKAYFKDGLYFVQVNQVYLYKSTDKGQTWSIHPSFTVPADKRIYGVHMSPDGSKAIILCHPRTNTDPNSAQLYFSEN